MSDGASGGVRIAPYAVRKLSFQFALGKGSFGGSGADKLSIGGLRASVTIEHAQGQEGGPSCVANIYGLTLNQMNSLSKAGLFFDTRQNEMVVTAGDDLSGMTTVFKGIIQEAYPVKRGKDVPFFVRASPGVLAKLKPVEPSSYSGDTDAKTALKTLAEKAGFKLEDNGINVQLASPYFAGSAWDQVVKAVRSSNLFMTLDSVSGVIAVWPKTGSRNGEAITIAKETGMIDSPQFAQSSVTVRTMFGPQAFPLMSGPGRKVRIKSQFTAANGVFTADSIFAKLESQTVGGAWEMEVTCHPAGVGQSLE